MFILFLINFYVFFSFFVLLYYFTISSYSRSISPSLLFFLKFLFAFNVIFLFFSCSSTYLVHTVTAVPLTPSHSGRNIMSSSKKVATCRKQSASNRNRSDGNGSRRFCVRAIAFDLQPTMLMIGESKHHDDVGIDVAETDTQTIGLWNHMCWKEMAEGR